MVKKIYVTLENENGNDYGKNVFVFANDPSEAYKAVEEEKFLHEQTNPTVWEQLNFVYVTKFDDNGSINRNVSIPAVVVEKFLDKKMTFGEMKAILKILK
jgi:hypothetical protein